MTLSYRHFERKREIFVIRGQMVDVWKSEAENLLCKKFESRDEWLGIRDWGLGVTSDW